jgi:hypothetical protein
VSTAVNGARRTFFAGCEAFLRSLAGSFSRGTDRIYRWADWCGERAR